MLLYHRCNGINPLVRPHLGHAGRRQRLRCAGVRRNERRHSIISEQQQQSPRHTHTQRSLGCNPPARPFDSPPLSRFLVPPASPTAFRANAKEIPVVTRGSVYTGCWFLCLSPCSPGDLLLFRWAETALFAVHCPLHTHTPLVYNLRRPLFSLGCSRPVLSVDDSVRP